jgi:hypothetical protein
LAGDWSLLLFLVLLTLINAPFDWASLGLTRALLRRGLELGGWWPYLLAVLDAILTAGIIALLAITMVLVVQTFDHLAEHGGGAPILPLHELFDGIAAHPASPEYWWLYALLLSSMIPSFINLMIGGASFLRGVPGLSSPLLRFMPGGKAVPPFDRSWIALVLAVQVFVGAFLGIAAQAFLAVGVILLHHALDWPWAARHGPRRGCVRFTGAGAGAVVGWFVVAGFMRNGHRRGGLLRASRRLPHLIFSAMPRAPLARVSLSLIILCLDRKDDTRPLVT